MPMSWKCHEMSTPLVSGYVSTRRKSVFAETYDPEDDDEKEERVSLFDN